MCRRCQAGGDLIHSFYTWGRRPGKCVLAQMRVCILLYCIRAWVQEWVMGWVLAFLWMLVWMVCRVATILEGGSMFWGGETLV